MLWLDVLDRFLDAYLAVRRLLVAVDTWARAPESGVILINGVESMTTTDTAPIDIPDDDTRAQVQWRDRLQEPVPGSRTTTAWSAEDQNGQPSTAVNVSAAADDDESATVSFQTGEGQFKIVATTSGRDGNPVRAESALYNITPGAPAVGVIQVNPV